MSASLRSVLIAALFVSGCARGALRYPGSTRFVGAAPDKPYAQRVQPTDAPEAAPKAVAEKRHERRASGDGHQVAAAAGELVGARAMTAADRSYRYDCSGMVEAAYARAGWFLRGGSKDLWALAEEEGLIHHKKRPSLGDVVFWDNTHDRNHNGRRDDELTHVGIVEAVLDDDTIRIVHLGGSGVQRIAMNLHNPGQRTDDNGDIINSYLRNARDARHGPVLAGELFRGFASLWKLPQDQNGANADIGCLKLPDEA